MANRTAREQIEENWEMRKCVSLNATEALFSAYMAAKTYEPGFGYWWAYTYDAAQSVAQLFSCSAPPEQVFIEAFEGENKRCQCAEVGGQLFLDWLDNAGNRVTLSNSEIVEAKQIKDAAIADGIASCNWVTVDGQDRLATYDIQDGSKPIWYIIPTLNTDCCSGSPIIPPVQPFPDPVLIPGDGIEGCPKDKIYLLDSTVDRFGLLQNFYLLKRYYQNCTVKPNVFYWETIRGPYVYDDRDSFEGFDSDPPYAPPHPHAPLPVVQGGGGTSSLSAVTYTLDAGCTYNQETEDFDTKFTYDVEANSDGIVGLARRMDALAWMINNSGLIPYTTCATTKPKLEGQWVSTHWVSDNDSAGGTDKLRKLFRYRTKSERTTDELQQFWKQLVWESGPVIVGHKGAWWGTPKVWAIDEAEGKRVLRFAGGEAGIDPDLDGEWFVASSRSPRYGMTGTMRLAMKRGTYWVTSRDGPSALPDLEPDS